MCDLQSIELPLGTKICFYIYIKKKKKVRLIIFFFFEQLEHGNWLEIYDRSHGQRFVLSMMHLRISITVIFPLTNIWRARVPTKVGFIGLTTTCGKLKQFHLTLLS